MSMDKSRSFPPPETPDHAARRLAAIVTSSDDAIVSKDLNGIVQSWNRGAERLFGYTAEEMIGRSIRTIIPQDRQHEEDETLAKIRRRELVDHFETVRVRKNGTFVSISLTVSPILDNDGTVIGASKIARDISVRLEVEAERGRLLALAQEHAHITERLNQVGRTVVSALDPKTVVQAVTDAATELTGAEFGAFFYNVHGPNGGNYLLYALSGASMDKFANFPHPRATAIFKPTFEGEAVVRLDDVTQDPRFGQNPPYHGMPEGHLPVRSYLAVPVIGRMREVIGGLFFGHALPGVFDEKHERLAVGMGVWAAVALENARLYANAQEASRLKDEFLATLSHELRTPLNAIVGYTRMMRSGLVTGEKATRALETVDRNANALTQIVEDVLDVSRIIAGKIRLNVRPVDLPLVVEEALDSVRPAADARGVKLEAVLDPRAGPVSGDPERLQQVVWNLVSNAVKFTPRGGRVQIRVQRIDSHIEIEVSDTGIGIPLSFLPHVFERFRQADGGISRERGGLGLGLAIVRHLAELHGGTVAVASGGEGQGATFRVRLPVMIVHVDPRTAPRGQTLGVAQDAAVHLPSLNGVRILAVDDDLDARTLVREILSAAGADVHTANSGAEALVTIERVKPHVLLADLGMPRMDGFELIQHIRASDDPAVRDVVAAALTAYARSEDRAKALRSGYEIHLSKPIDPAELVATMSALSRRALRR
jgi:PAS domain S-box-containing protein